MQIWQISIYFYENKPIYQYRLSKDGEIESKCSLEIGNQRPVHNVNTVLQIVLQYSMQEQLNIGLRVLL